jgi:hypothetical protein
MQTYYLFDCRKAGGYIVSVYGPGWLANALCRLLCWRMGTRAIDCHTDSRGIGA